MQKSNTEEDDDQLQFNIEVLNEDGKNSDRRKSFGDNQYDNLVLESQDESGSEEYEEDEGEAEVSKANSDSAYKGDDVQKLLWNIDGINPDDYVCQPQPEGHDASGSS